MARKIMFVDDELDMEVLMRQKFRKQIRKKEFEFIFAHNGLEAMTLLVDNQDIDMILTDINMPEMDGLTLLSKLTELHNPTLKTVIVSAYGDMENIRTAMNRGAFDFVTKPINFDDLDITINKTLTHVESLKQYLKDRDKLASIENDLSIARNIQQSILPKDFPAFPERKDFDIFASMNAAKSIGGDFYDFFLIDEDRIGLVIADVSGKGIPAALFMAVSRTVIHAAAMKELPPDECMKFSNNLLCKENINTMFVTTFYGIVNLKTGVFEYANAGHNPPYVMKSSGETFRLPIHGDLFLGGLENMGYHKKEIQLEPGDSLYLYTDGVTEAMNYNRELYSDERLLSELEKITDKNPKEVCEFIIESIADFTINAEQSDDITMLTFKYLG